MKTYIKNNIRFLVYGSIFVLGLSGESCSRVSGPVERICYNFSKEDPVHDTPLFLAVRIGDVQAFMDLVASGVNLCELYKKDKYTVLHLAIKQYCLNKSNSDLKQLYENLIVELIKLGGVQLLNAQDLQGYTPLHYAVCFKEHSLFSFLLNAQGIDVNVQDNMGDTALHKAVRQNVITFVQGLLDYKDINVNLQNKFDKTPLSIAVINKNLKMVQYLLSNTSIKVNQLDKDGNTALHCAIEQLEEDPLGLEIVYCLLHHKDIDVRLQNKAGASPLALAHTKQKPKMFKLLEDYAELMKNPTYTANLAKALQQVKENLTTARQYNHEGSFPVMDANDKILVGKQAKIKLDQFLKDARNKCKWELVYWDLDNKAYCKEPPGVLSAFKKFYQAHYKKGKHFRADLLEVKEVGKEDRRTGLHGQHKVVAREDIPAGTLLGIYTGTLLAENEIIPSRDLEAEYRWLVGQSAGGLNKMEDYAFHIELNENELLCLSGFGRGNVLMKINANSTYEDKTTEKANVQAAQMRYKSGIPFVAFWSAEGIKENQELLFDYGREYWEAHKANYTNLSRPDAPIYQNYLETNPSGSSLSLESFLRRKHPKVYRKIKTEGPESPEEAISLDLEDKMVQVIGIDIDKEIGTSSAAMRLYAKYDANTMEQLRQDYEVVTYEAGSCHPFYNLVGKK